ncbi:MAG: FG-GAP-like repeat-containing protein [Acidobacteriota bacterium]
MSRFAFGSPGRCALLLALVACGPTDDRRGPTLADAADRLASGGDQQASMAGTTEPSFTGPIFDDATEAVGLDFVHYDGAVGELWIVEVMGAGAALADFDDDGDLDAFLVQGNRLDGPPNPALVDRLWRNDLQVDAEGIARPRFVDITEASGLRSSGYGMGVAVGDADGDRRPDLYVTRDGPNALWLQRGAPNELRFEPAGSAAGVDAPAWSVGAVFLDASAGADVRPGADLFVANYVDFPRSTSRTCFHRSSARDYCGPGVFRPLPDRLFRNRGVDATGRPRFTEVADSAGLAAVGPGLGVAAVDFDDDGHLDLFVANDAEENRLWRGLPEARFRDDGLLAGCAVNGAAEREASMGVAVGDVDGDGDFDLFLTHLEGETNTLYENRNGVCRDVTAALGLAAPSWRSTGFGTGFLDLDNDGRLDLFAVNGAVKLFSETAPSADAAPLGQLDQLFWQRADGRFLDVSSLGGSAFERRDVGRGAAFGDVDNDGDVDVLIANNGGRARLLLNRVGQDRSWIGLDLRRRDGGVAIGAVVQRVAETDRRVFRVARDGSYASSSDPRVLVGLGDEELPVTIEVRWPDGSRERFSDLAPRRYHRLVEDSAVSDQSAPKAEAFQARSGGSPRR